MTNQSPVEGLRQQLAAIEHERWADWQKWVHSGFYTIEDKDGTVHWCVKPEYIDRWEQQIATKYEDLTESEQASDMEQVDRYWPLVTAYAATVEREAVSRELKQLVADTLTPENVGGHFIHDEVKEFAKQQREFIDARLAALQGAQKETDEPTM